jgi:hypothetical protein
MGSFDDPKSLDLDNMMRDFKSIRNSDFGYDTHDHFLDFLDTKKSKWAFVYRQILPEDKKRETLVTKLIGKNTDTKYKKRRTNREMKLTSKRKNKGHKGYLDVARPSFNVIVSVRNNSEFL